ncbi:MAG: hypothetical protein FH753_13795 [Firmicutes bacterium]|nr:hypothetical protein [Bacillota bacterium]
MKLPFIKGEIFLTQERLDFIKNTRGGSSGVFAGGFFWILAVIVSLVTSKEIASIYYIFGGIFIIPIVGSIISKISGAKIEKSSYNFLVIITNMLFAFLYPLIVIIRSYNLDYIPSTIALINAAHLLIFVWIHYELLHLILALLGFIISSIFIFIFPEVAYIGVGGVSALVNLIFGYLVYKSTDEPLSDYNYKVIDK